MPRIGLVVGLATVMFYGVMMIWACVTPDFRAPDEPQQVSTTLRLAYVHSYPAPGDARIYLPVKASYADVGFGGIGLNTIIGLAPLHRPTSTQLTSQTMRELGAAAPTCGHALRLRPDDSAPAGILRHHGGRGSRV